jgi:hypothetical protein
LATHSRRIPMASTTDKALESHSFPIEKAPKIAQAFSRNQTFKRLQSVLVANARRIHSQPHDPESRFRRGKTLLDLGYHEFAVGDFHRAGILLKWGLNYS